MNWDTFWGGCIGVAAGWFFTLLWRSPSHEAQELERHRRIYYQDIVYDVCRHLDEIDGDKISKGFGIVCGSVGEPSTEVQRRMKQLAEEIKGYRDHALNTGPVEWGDNEYN
jgi:hypothetical protein